MRRMECWNAARRAMLRQRNRLSRDAFFDRFRRFNVPIAFAWLLRAAIASTAAAAATPTARAFRSALACALLLRTMFGRVLGVACPARAFAFFIPGWLRFAAWLSLLLLWRAANPLKVRRVFLLFEKVGDVEKCVALETQVDECRLHAWQNARNTAFVNGTREGIFVFALVVDFRELIVF